MHKPKDSLGEQTVCSDWFLFYSALFLKKTTQQFMKYQIVRTTISQFGFCFSIFSSYKILLFLKIKNGSEKKEFPLSFFVVFKLYQNENRIIEPNSKPNHGGSVWFSSSNQSVHSLIIRNCNCY